MPFVARAFLTLLVVIDPVGLMPIFMTLTGKYTPAQQDRIAQRAVIVAGGILVVFALIGNGLLRYLGISIEAFQIAAGLLLLKIAVDMVFAQRERETAEEEQEAYLRDDISVFPLAIPLIAGPGTLASLLILTTEVNGRSFGMVILLSVVVVVLGIAYIVFRLSKRLASAFGQTGINVVTRVLGVLLSALAVQYVLTGVMSAAQLLINAT
ncbi:MAG: MarC family protein [Plectolyngbya sp. WJT66-NPBG17]|jgi:multiple antibiotic resistance protein|nr:MarC family protein [Plectolyngbya sp. WJT66-NPBG17]